MGDVYHYGYNWMHDHYEHGDYGLVAVPVIFFFFIICLIFIVFDCFTTGAARAYNGGRKIVYITTLPVTLPIRYAYNRINQE